MNKKIIFIAGFLILAGCSSSRFYMTGNRFLIPETGGSFAQGEARAGGVGVAQIEISPNITVATPDTAPDVSSNSTASVGVELGILSFVDLYYHTVVGAPGYAGLKIQLLGDSRAQAKAGNFSVAIAGGGYFGDSKHTADESGATGVSELEYSGFDGSVIIGYRPSDSVILYISPFKTELEADVTITRTPSGGSAAVTATPNGEGEMKGVALGLRLGHHFFANFEVAVTETVWNRQNPTVLASEKLQDTSLGVALGGAW